MSCDHAHYVTEISCARKGATLSYLPIKQRYVLSILMASQGLLAVPSKSTKSIDFSQAFLRFIGNNYDDSPGTYREAIKEFQSLRDSTVVRSPDKHETGLDLILRCVCMHVSAYKCFQLVLIIDYHISLNDMCL